jgi:hypothetical protein
MEINFLTKILQCDQFLPRQIPAVHMQIGRAGELVDEGVSRGADTPNRREY